MDSYRPHSRAGHRFRAFHMFVDELCLQLVGDYSSPPPRSPGPAVRPPSFAGHGTTLPRTFPGRHRQKPLRGLLCQVQQVPEETPGHRLRKHAPQAGEDHVLVLHMPQVPLSVSAAHAGVTITLKFSFGVEPSPE